MKEEGERAPRAEEERERAERQRTRAKRGPDEARAKGLE